MYIQTGKLKDVCKQIRDNSNVEICAFDGQTWLRISGNLLEDDRYEAKKAMLDCYPSLQNMYRADDDNTVVLYFEHAKAIFCSFVAEPRIIEW